MTFTPYLLLNYQGICPANFATRKTNFGVAAHLTFALFQSSLLKLHVNSYTVTVFLLEQDHYLGLEEVLVRF